MQAQNQTVILSGSCFPQAQFAAENSVSAISHNVLCSCPSLHAKDKALFFYHLTNGCLEIFFFQHHRCILYLLYMQVMKETNLKWLFSYIFLTVPETEVVFALNMCRTTSESCTHRHCRTLT